MRRRVPDVTAARRLRLAWGIAGGCVTASVAGAALAVAGPDHSATLAAPQQAPTVVLEREYEDTVVVVGGPTTTRSPLAGPAAARIAGTTTTASTAGSLASGSGQAARATAPTSTPSASAAGAAATGIPAPTTTAASPPATTRPAGSSPTSAPATTVPTTTVPAQSRAYSSAGGTFTLSWTSRSMTVSAVNPSPGYRARVEGNGTKEIHLVFSSPTRDLEIQITLQGDQPIVQGL